MKEAMMNFMLTLADLCFCIAETFLIAITVFGVLFGAAGAIVLLIMARTEGDEEKTETKDKTDSDPSQKGR